jgi:hypothetical protein
LLVQFTEQTPPTVWQLGWIPPSVVWKLAVVPSGTGLLNRSVMRTVTGTVTPSISHASTL